MQNKKIITGKLSETRSSKCPTNVSGFEIYTVYLRRKGQYSGRSQYWSFKKKKRSVCMCPIPNGFRDTAISLCCTMYKQATCHVLTRVTKCTDVGIFENVLYYINCPTFIT
jgi:hypothetical protein